MDWQTEWSALHDRVVGVEHALNLFLSGSNVHGTDPYGVRRKVFRPELTALVGVITTFRDSHGSSLPVTALNTINRFLMTHGPLLSDSQLDNTAHVLACVTALSGFRTELGYQLANRSAVTLRITERALEHLQRSIVADKDVRSRWQDAFTTGEVACEQLGAVHLLLHGIWAFKVSAEGERTDLVYNDVIHNAHIVARTATALVLTEWKLIRSAAELDTKLALAKRQAALYSKGVLGGVELADSRFLILVAQDRLHVPADSQQGNVTYRVRCIAVAPSSPSRSSVT